MWLLSKVLPIRVVFSTVHEVGREEGVLPISVGFSTVHEVGREQGVQYLLESKIHNFVLSSDTYVLTRAHVLANPV